LKDVRIETIAKETLINEKKLANSLVYSTVEDCCLLHSVDPCRAKIKLSYDKWILAYITIHSTS